MAARNTIVEVAVPTTDQWRRAPYVQTVCDPFWALVEAYPAKGAPVANPTFFTTPTDLGQAELVNPSSILHLRIERGDLPYTECRFGPQASPPIDWAEWVDEIVYDVPRKQILMGSGTYNAVMLSQSLDIKLANNDDCEQPCLEDIVIAKAHYTVLTRKNIAENKRFL
ncbi:hypothetical protein RHMOL_Rhmol10G0209900 [Rhododendron molle]|uniref:Uncharacterized protein n=1 Tax=Rhododendron molle TaxID=49168 RepID=A0ACC0M4V6_RHOML|nr:hypothetical protein RHMOL_Rhmol10G0209900 [Rhododendron molle]